ncbi:MAG: molybdopterin-binding protein [Deltaproteobacteria bacterium]|nr:molybdopterin-binding protein [Deltaproteobacteria bacterium]
MSTASAFSPLGIRIVTVSDSRGVAEDRSGDLLIGRLEAAGHRLVERRIVKDEQPAIEAALREGIEDPETEVVIATGGTGITGRDVTPEALEAVWEKALPGFGELFRQQSVPKIGTAAMLSRACAGVARGTLLFALPGSTGGCADAWDGILSAQLDNTTKPCSLATLLPRLQEV